MKKLSLALALVLTSAAALEAQCATLPVSPVVSANAQSGYMFDIDNISAGTINITGFSVVGSGAAANVTFNIYALNVTGSFLALAANLTTAANWTLVGTSSGVALAATPVQTRIPAVINVPIAPSTTQAFYVTTTGTGTLRYHNGTTAPYVLGGIIATDGTLNCRGGVGKGWLAGATFGSTFGGTVLGTGGRLFEGQVHYATGPFGSYDTNTAGASLDANGVQGTACGAASSTLCAGTPVTVTAASDQIGLGFDLAYNVAGLKALGSGGLLLGTQAILNLDLGAGLFFLNGGVAPLLLPQPGSIPIPFGMPVLPAPGLSAQLFQISAASPDGFELSQAINLIGLATASGAAGPAGDDIAFSLTAGQVVAGAPAPNCTGGFTAPAVSLYGTVYTQYHVITNGRVVMGAVANTSYTSAATYGATEAAFAGIHGDFNTATAGNITMNNVGGSFQVNYNGIGFFGGTAANVSTYQFNFDAATSNVIFSNVSMGVPTASRTVFMGVHPGGAATIEAGFPTTYVGSGSFLSALSGNSHGLFGDLFAGALTDAADAISFTYNGAGGYNVTF